MPYGSLTKAAAGKLVQGAKSISGGITGYPNKMAIKC
jgi:hypothetical protein